jgi:hypothetical protein
MKNEQLFYESLSDIVEKWYLDCCRRDDTDPDAGFTFKDYYREDLVKRLMAFQAQFNCDNYDKDVQINITPPDNPDMAIHCTIKTTDKRLMSALSNNMLNKG